MKRILISLLVFLIPALASAGPYSDSMYDPGKIDSAIPGWVGIDGDGKMGGNNTVNPVFVEWATGYLNYLPSAYIQSMPVDYGDPTRALGPVPDEGNDVVSLGDMTQAQIDAWLANPDPGVNQAPGEITLTFDYAIKNGTGADFAVFENAFINEQGGAGDGYTFAELGYVEVSTDGVNWARFESDSLVEDPFPYEQPYGVIDPTDVYNLAGKHVNNYGDSWGTPFDLDTLSDDPMVLQMLVDLNNINYVKIKDIPGTGDFLDASGDGILDAYYTFGTGGFDLDAVGVINAVPIPGAVWLMGSGFFALVGLRRKRQ